MRKPGPNQSRHFRPQVLLLLGASMLALSACSPGSMAAPPVAGTTMGSPRKTSMKIRINVDGQLVTATLDDNATTRDFATLLPLSLTLKDFARIERIDYLPRKLASGRATTGVPVKAGDIAYYAPWGNLAIFVADGDGDYDGDLVRLGRVDSGLPALQRPAPLKARIERVED